METRSKADRLAKASEKKLELFKSISNQAKAVCGQYLSYYYPPYREHYDVALCTNFECQRTWQADKQTFGQQINSVFLAGTNGVNVILYAKSKEIQC